MALDVAPRIFDERGLLDLIEKLADLGWATPDARWSIQQGARNWHGLGAAAFAEELPRWPQRDATPDAHHSEQVCYFDRCDAGFYTLTATLSPSQSRRATYVGLSFQLQGIPLNTSSLLQLCRSVGVHDSLHLRPRAEKSVNRHHAQTVTIDNVQPIGYLVTLETDPALPSAEWVTGIVIRNPFRDTADGTRHDDLVNDLRLLGPSEYLVCALRHQHPVDDRQYSYFIRRIEVARSSDAMACQPVVDWRPADVEPAAIEMD